MKKLALLLVTILTLNTVEGISSTLLPVLQDPARTPKNSKQVDPVNTVDGSRGKYKKDHKHSTGKDFATRKRHVKTAKTKKDNGKEKQSTKTPDKKG
ncbi:hypothetical protein CNR22_16980 [Sphingobacteriaceae bacterium]|nr:hypothetical protein CNR22_16980 [Sphingobacteriaceae bacterium]